ncbi:MULTISPECIES: hypothetical protein [unclassified Microcoleus]
MLFIVNYLSNGEDLSIVPRRDFKRLSDYFTTLTGGAWMSANNL